MDFVMSNILCIQMNFGLLGKLVIFPFLKQHWREEVLDFAFNCSRLRRTNKLPYSFHWTSKKDFPVQTWLFLCGDLRSYFGCVYYF